MTPALVPAIWGAGTAAAISFGWCAYGMFAPNSTLFGHVIGRGPREGRTLFLTFDDGPNPGATDRILEVLEERSVPAAFFSVQTGDSGSKGLRSISGIAGTTPETSR